MTVRIGKIELIAVQSVHTQEARTLAEQRVPEQQGSVFQDLGREPVTIVIEGLLVGADVLETLEKLRDAHSKAEPQTFAADIAVGTELAKVVIEDVRVRQPAGFRDRYVFSIRLREHVEPPAAPGADLAPVNAAVSADAAAWGEGTLAAAGVLQDPAGLPDALAANPALLDHLDMHELGAAVARNVDAIDAGQLDGMVGALAEANPAKAASFFDKLGKAGALGPFLAKYASQGIEFLKKIDPKKLSALMTAFKGGLDFLKQLKAVADQAGKLAADVKDLQLPAELAQLLKGGMPGIPPAGGGRPGGAR